MRVVIYSLIVLFIFSSAAGAVGSGFARTSGSDLPLGSHFVLASACFNSGEQISRLSKICFYDCVGSAVMISIKSTSLCPAVINKQR